MKVGLKRPPLQEACMWLWAQPYHQECELIVEVNCIWDSHKHLLPGLFKDIGRVLIIGPALVEQGGLED
ncbi:hypothetical protein AC578_8903 [Pseudocercospora eumusae]|uniref:Uncharacterized protein n=1 Tax=Pseudocercospora eumusae TaxID=321146 RepID=A0A139HBH6_9PEZI|nr:hypothetical protein AC578_8903 [Pseudocercospora eumusae]